LLGRAVAWTACRRLCQCCPCPLPIPRSCDIPTSSLFPPSVKVSDTYRELMDLTYDINAVEE